MNHVAVTRWQSLSKNQDRFRNPRRLTPTCHPANHFIPTMDLHQGDCIRLPETLAGDQASNSQLYQVIGLDAHSDRCWLRCWPLARRGSPVFELALSAVGPVACRHLPRAC